MWSGAPPFRQDLREMLAEAVEMSVGDPQPHRPPQPMPRAHRASPPPAPPLEPRPPRREDPPTPPYTIEPPDVTPSPRRRPMERPRDWTPPSAPGKARPQTPPPHPSHFEKRHRRGPMSALVLGGLIGLLLAGGIVAFLYYYTGALNQSRPSEPAGLSQGEINSLQERARNYQQQGQYSLAIEQLKQLPPGPERDGALSKIFMDQGDRSVMATPSRSLMARWKHTKRRCAAIPIARLQTWRWGRLYYRMANEKNKRSQSPRRIHEPGASMPGTSRPSYPRPMRKPWSTRLRNWPAWQSLCATLPCKPTPTTGSWRSRPIATRPKMPAATCVHWASRTPDNAKAK